MTRKERARVKREIEIQLWRIDEYRRDVAEYRSRLTEIESRISEACAGIEAAKRELYRLGWKG